MHWSPLLPLYIGLRTTPLFLYSIESYWSLVGQTLSLLFRKRLWMVSMVSIGRLHLQWVLCLNFKPTGSAFNFCELIGCQTIKLGKSKREERILTCAVYCSLLWWSTRHQIPWWVLAWLLPYSYHMPHTCNYTMRSHTPTVCTSSRTESPPSHCMIYETSSPRLALASASVLYLTLWWPVRCSGGLALALGEDLREEVKRRLGFDFFLNWILLKYLLFWLLPGWSLLLQAIA